MGPLVHSIRCQYLGLLSMPFVPRNSRHKVAGQAAAYMGNVCRQVGHSCTVEWPWAKFEGRLVHKACTAPLNGLAYRGDVCRQVGHSYQAVGKALASHVPWMGQLLGAKGLDMLAYR